MRFTRLVLALLVLAALASLAGCSAADDTESSQSSDLVSRGDVLARAESWVSVKMPYCQVPNHVHDIDPYCSAICTRPDDATWNPYRSDCSGFVSYAWGLGAPGRVTMQFAPFVNDITHTIDALDLEPGDALNNNEHVMLFEGWVQKGAVATLLEEPGCQSSQPYARQVTTNVSVSGDQIHVASNGMTFYAIRLNAIGAAAPQAPAVPNFRVLRSQAGAGYWQYENDGAVFSFGDAKYSGGANTFTHLAPIVGMAADPAGGYWQAAQDGAIYAFGAPYHGGANTITHSGKVIGVAASAGSGYWEATDDGAIYSFGDAAYHGGANGTQHAPMIAIVATPSGKGYWLLASDGAVYSYGDAAYHGGAKTIAHAAPIVDMAAAAAGGYWIVASDGAIYSFGAPYHGGANTVPHPAPIVGIAATTGSGYWLSASDGAVYSFGDAAYHGGANAH